jgi:hypothetical protein
VEDDVELGEPVVKYVFADREVEPSEAEGRNRSVGRSARSAAKASSDSCKMNS